MVPYLYSRTLKQEAMVSFERRISSHRAQKGFKMLGSMYSAVSGLSAHQTKMNVIGNNIANVNTYGFKSSRVTFSDVFYQTMNGASAPTANGGGTNPTQLGYGAKVNSVDVINTRAGSATTDRALDVYINGDGYLPTKNSDGVIKYTRVGVLSFDVSGNLVDSNGNQVLGFKLDAITKNAQLNSDGTTSAQNLVAIKVDPADLDEYTGIAIGQNGEITAIKEGDPTFVPSADTAWMDATPTVSQASLYNGSVRMTVNQQSTGVPPLSISSNADIDLGQAAGAVTVSLDAASTIYTLTFPNGTAEANAADINTATTPNTLTFNVPDVDGGTAATVKVPVGVGGYAPVAGGAAAAAGNVVPTTYTITATTTDKSGAIITLTDTWTAADTSITLGEITIAVDAAEMQNALDDGFNQINIGTIGAGAGEPVKIANIAVAKFTNANALSQDGEGYFIQTTNSGEAVATIPGNGGTGTFRAGALEMSNVDLSREFTEMIITQRGFQANTRMITVSDEMLSELVSMKR